MVPSEPETLPSASLRRPTTVVTIIGIVLAVACAVTLVALRAHRDGSATSAPPRQLATLCPSLCPSRAAGTGTGAVQYAVPVGFTYSRRSFQQVRPLFPVYSGRYLELDGAQGGAEVLAIITYSLPADIDTSSDIARVSAIEARGEPATPLSAAPTVTKVGSLAGVTVAGTQPVDTPSGAVDYQYRSWFLFLPSTVVQVNCQYRDHKIAITAGCQSLLDSITAL